MKNKVIVIGINHFNTIGLIRSYGVNGLRPHLILVAPTGANNFCAKSKYLSGVDIVENDEQVLEVLRNKFSDEIVKPVLAPSSDGAIYMMDSHHDELKAKYILPHINNRQGGIAHLMNKLNQAEWCKELGIKTARTYLVDFENLRGGGGQPLEDYPMLCIVKPVLSHEGSKGDIKKCDTKEELQSYIGELKAKGYHRILLQEFLFKDYEMELFGAMLEHQKRIPYILTKHIREWHPVGGSVCCHQFILDEELHRQAREILQKIQAYGYVGNFDIEIINVGGKIYLNEINFRNSGDIYCCFHQKLFYSYYGYLDMIGENAEPMKTDYHDRYYAMCEDRDIMWVRHKMISFKEWFKYFRKTKDFAYFSWRDMRPTMAHYNTFFKGFIRYIDKRWKAAK